MALQSTKPTTLALSEGQVRLRATLNVPCGITATWNTLFHCRSASEPPLLGIAPFSGSAIPMETALETQWGIRGTRREDNQELFVWGKGKKKVERANGIEDQGEGLERWAGV